MTPEQLAKESEHSQQCAVFAWCNMAMLFGVMAASDEQSYKVPGHAKKYIDSGFDEPVPELAWYHAIPNGAFFGHDKKGAQKQGAKLKAEGLKPGVSDTFLPVKRGKYSGLYIELKRKGQKIDPKGKQVEFGKFVMEQGFKFVVCDCWKSAVHELKIYIKS